MAAAVALLSSAHAQIGALLLFDSEFERAVDHLLEAGLQAFRPAEMFALFPHLTARWHALVGTALALTWFAHACAVFSTVLGASNLTGHCEFFLFCA